MERFYHAPSEYLLSCDTYQFSDYSLYEVGRFDVEEKERIRKEQFPNDCKKAFELGRQLVTH
jgi:hypothetical protein